MADHIPAMQGHAMDTPMPLPPIPPEASVSGEDNLPLLPRALLDAKLRLKLDGREVYSCVSYSIPQGFVRVQVGNGNGVLVKGEGDAAEIVTVKVGGRVEVEPKAATQLTSREGDRK